MRRLFFPVALDWGHSICGAWGCGPPLQALLACHLAWLVILAPPGAVLVRSARVPAHILQRFGTLLCVLAVVFVTTLLVHQRIAWWPAVSEWQRGYFWQRRGFVIATMVDFSMAQVLLRGMYLLLGRRRQMYDS